MAMSPASMVVDYIVFLVFIVTSTCIPLISKVSSPKTKADYVFATSGGVSMAAMMLSIARGTLGVRSFLGFPSELFYLGSAMWETLYGMLCAYPLVAFIFVPVYYSLGITSVYQYLDLRFKSRTVRCLASGTFVWRQLLSLGVTVFTPCVALKTVIGLPYWASILGITLISIIFTVLGGLKAAIKADVIQGITMILLSLAIIVQGCVEVGGVGPVFNRTIENGRLNFFDFKWDLTVRVDTMSAWAGQLFMSLSLFGCQQNFVQRYCSMNSESKVRKTLLYNIPVIIVLFSLSWVVGMVIYATYFDCDPLTAGYTKKVDEILPFFVEDKFVYLPGLMGLFLGSLFNGALSLLVSNLNSLATVTWEDFLSQAPAFKGMKDNQQLAIIKILGAIYGVIIMGVSFGVSLLSGVIESSMLMTSATSGPLLGVFILAMLVPCANKTGAAVGMVAAHVASIWLAVGHLMFRNETEYLPLSTEGCTNETFAAHITKPSQQWFEPITPLEVNSNAYLISQVADTHSEDPSNPLLPLYSISYMYYALIGTTVTVTVGVIVSLIWKNHEDTYDEKLIHPLALRISRWFPGPSRKYTTTSSAVVSSNVDICPAKLTHESDNLGFEIHDTNANCKTGFHMNGDLQKKSDNEVSTDNTDDNHIKPAKENGQIHDMSINSRHFENYSQTTRNHYPVVRRPLSKADTQKTSEYISTLKDGDMTTREVTRC